MRKIICSLVGMVLASICLSGCAAPRNDDEIPGDLVQKQTGVFRVGDLVIVKFSGTGVDVAKDHDEKVREDGTITLPTVGAVEAVGKTANQLQKELQTRYQQFYRHINVTVTEVRYYYVYGQVMNRNKFIHDGSGITVLKALASAGGFTDFANKRKVEIRRASGGRPLVVNCDKAMDNPSLDLPIYPGDIIHVKRRLLW